MKKESMPKSKKNKAAKVLLTVLCLLLVALCTVIYVFREEIKILYSAMTSSEEALVSRREENDKKQNELLGEIAVETMRDLTEEERKLLAEGKLTYEEALALIRGETIAPVTTEVIPEVTEEVSAPEQTKPHTPSHKDPITPSQTTAATVQTTTEVTTAEETTTEVVTTEAVTTEKPMTEEELKARKEEIIAEIYLLRATYLNKIEELIANTKKEYIALPKSEHNLNGKMRMVEKVIIPKGNALEKECNEKMKLLLDELSVILKKLGENDAIVGEIEKAYDEQKEIKKTELINEYMPKAK